MTTNDFLESEAKKLKFFNFRGVIFKDELVKLKPLNIECGILGSKNSSEDNMHWTAWFKYNKNKFYFDSYGMEPCPEFNRYLKSPILCNTYQIQQFTDSNCGEWCLWFLYRMNELFKQNHKIDDIDFIDLILEIINK